MTMMNKKCNRNIHASPDALKAECERLLDYNRETGNFTWRVDRSSKARKGELAGCEYRHRVIGFHGRLYLAHHLVWLVEHGNLPIELDHINGNPLDNRIENLRHVSHAENMRNVKRRADNTSGLHGVRKRKESYNWSAEIRCNNVVYRLGTYEDFFEAVCARKSAELKHDFHINHGR